MGSFEVEVLEPANEGRFEANSSQIFRLVDKRFISKFSYDSKKLAVVSFHDRLQVDLKSLGDVMKILLLESCDGFGEVVEAFAKGEGLKTNTSESRIENSVDQEASEDAVSQRVFEQSL